MRNNPNTFTNSQADSTETPRGGLYYSAIILYFIRHLQACLSSLGNMSLTPFATILTVSVIGVSMALPAGLLVLLHNTEGLLNVWQDSTNISLFLKVDTTPEQAQQVLAKLQKMPTIAKTKYISPQQGLKQFQRSSGFSEALNALPKNPLPPVIEIQPIFSQQTQAQMQHLMMTIKQLPFVNEAQLDTQWVKRLYAIVDLVKRGIWALGVLLALGVILVVGNTIRLLTQNKRHEIKVLKLVGASNGFVRRPFLYSGMFYGIFGAIMAWFFVDIILLWLNRPITALAHLYQSTFGITGMQITSILMLLLLGGMLGFFGAYLAASKHIKAMNPV